MRGVGYCENTECIDFHKGVFLLNFSTQFYCPVCRSAGQLVPEQRDAVDDISASLYTTTIVNFDYTPADKRYRSQAIIKMEHCREGKAYTYSSPLIKTQARALKMAESLLAALNNGTSSADLLLGETVLSFDQSATEFKVVLKKLEAQLSERDRRLNEY